jgi:hypothetical protein
MKYKIQISTGELVDKITILEIKISKIKDEQKLKNVKKEYAILVKNIPDYKDIEQYEPLFSVNKQLWNVEDKLRKMEKEKKFDLSFVELARKVYKLNDKRASLKREINIECGSDLIEEKQYVNY